METFDFIIIGAGSAGSVLADRLTASGAHRVLLLEAGGSDRWPWVRMPIGYGKTFFDKRLNWCFMAEADPGLEGRQIYWPRGKVLGGSSSINGLVWMRGLPVDFDQWADAGNPGWSWKDVAPIFDRIEARGTGRSRPKGRISVATREKDCHPIGRMYLRAARAVGLPRQPEGEGHWREGVGAYQITTGRGLRHSASDAFLRPAMRRKKLALQTHVLVDRIGFENKVARFVHYVRDGQPMQAEALQGVILAAGAVGSPMLLQRSGIGPGALLQNLGIDCVHENEAVGGGLQDHIGIDYLFRANHPTLNQVLGTLRGQVRAALVFALKRSGALSLSVNQMGGMVRSAPAQADPDLQLYFNPLSYTTKQKNKRMLLRPDPWPGFAFGFNTCRPTSRGRIDIQSADPSAAPKIAPNYVSTEEDITSVIAGARLIEKMLQTKPLKELVDAPNGFSPVGASDSDILAHFRQRASTVFHACGTCRMAPEDKGGVVDASLKVHGVEGLRVVDASVFPNITSANTNAPTIMAATKAADMILSG